MSKRCHRHVTTPAYLLRPLSPQILVTSGNTVRAGLISLDKGCPSLPSKEDSEGMHTSQSHIPVPVRDPGTETSWDKGAIPVICASPQLGESQPHWHQCSSQCMEQLLGLSRPLQVLRPSGSCLKLPECPAVPILPSLLDFALCQEHHGQCVPTFCSLQLRAWPIPAFAFCQAEGRAGFPLCLFPWFLQQR